MPEYINPVGWPRPPGYSNVVAAEGRRGGDRSKFLNAVALQVAPPRSSTSSASGAKTPPPAKAAGPAAAPEEDGTD